MIPSHLRCLTDESLHLSQPEVGDTVISLLDLRQHLLLAQTSRVHKRTVIFIIPWLYILNPQFTPLDKGHTDRWRDGASVP